MSWIWCYGVLFSISACLRKIVSTNISFMLAFFFCFGSGILHQIFVQLKCLKSVYKYKIFVNGIVRFTWVTIYAKAEAFVFLNFLSLSKWMCIIYHIYFGVFFSGSFFCMRGTYTIVHDSWADWLWLMLWINGVISYEYVNPIINRLLFII